MKESACMKCRMRVYMFDEDETKTCASCGTELISVEEAHERIVEEYQKTHQRVPALFHHPDCQLFFIDRKF